MNGRVKFDLAKKLRLNTTKKIGNHFTAEFGIIYVENVTDLSHKLNVQIECQLGYLMTLFSNGIVRSTEA